METLVSVKRAQELLANHSFKWVTEEVSLSLAQGRILAEDVFAKCDDPAFDNSSIDGWAVQSTDLPKSRIEVGTIFAGTKPITIPIKPNEIYFYFLIFEN